MTTNAIEYGLMTFIQFTTAPNRGDNNPIELIQATAMSTALANPGCRYIYNKALHYKVSHPLTYPNVSSIILAQLQGLHTEIDGGRNLFTWYDHDGISHNCRFDGPIKYIQTGPDRYRVSLDMLELIEITPPAVASWSAAVSAVSGSFPCWIFKLTINAVDYWLSDHVFAVDGFCSTTLPVVKSWGAIQSGITGGLDEYNVSDFSVDLLVDPDASPSLRELSLLYEFEENPAELYLWFHGLDPLAEPPRLKWRGYVRDHPEMDDTTIRLECEDESVRLTKNIGTLLSNVTYPEADPKDVGKVIPIIYGNTKKLPALGAIVGNKTTLPVAITAAAVSFDVSDSTGLNGSTIQIDDEQIDVYSVSGNTLFVNRGVSGTLPATHNKGAAAWEYKAEYIFIAGEKVDSFDRVYGTIDELPIDINSVCTRYAGQPGNEHPSGLFAGLAVVSLPGVLSLTQMENLGVARSGLAARSGNIQDYSVNSPTHIHGVQTSRAQVNSNSGSVYGGSGYSSVVATPTYPAVSNIIEQTNNYTFAYGGDTTAKSVYVNGVLIQSGYSSASSVSWSGTTVGLPNIQVNGGGTNTTLTILSCNRTVLYTADSVATNPAISKTAANNGTLAVSDTIAVYLTGVATIRNIISNNILCDVSSNIYLPGDVEQDLLTRSGGGALTTVGGYPAYYRFDGAITEHKSGRYWLDYIAFQCRSWFIQSAGVAKLIMRPDALISSETLFNCLLSGNKRSLKISKAPLTDVINVGTCRYDRDYSITKSAEGYRKCVTYRREESVGYYGEKEGAPELFWFDLVANPIMASNVLTYYLDKYNRRYRIYKFATSLVGESLQFSEGVTLGFEGNTILEITAVDPAPGSKSQLDRIEFTAVDIHRGW